MSGLLYIKKEEITHKLSEEEFSALMTGDALSSVIPEKNLLSAFISVLSSPLYEKENILYRQEILRDFIKYPFFCDEMYSCFIRFSAAVSEYNRTRQEEKGIMRGNDRSEASKGIITLASVSSLIIKLLSLIKATESRLRDVPFCSEGLRGLKTRLEKICASEGYSELYSVAKRFEALDACPMRAEISVSLNSLAFLSDISVLDGYCEIMRAEKPKKHSLFGKADNKPAEKADEYINLTYDSYSTEKLIGAGLTDVSDALISAANCILSEFGGICDDLMFYKGAMMYIKALDTQQIPYVFPEISEKTEFCGIYDLFLLFKNGKDNVIKGDFSFTSDCGGVLVRGENGSGKTVYLRSVTAAFLFSQAGLPVAAERAFVSPAKCVNVLMASGEKTLDIGDDAGRFEEEVIKLKGAVEASPPGSVVMLNEFFQTTAYDEGAEGLYYILKYLSSSSVRWICVTHLPDLFERFKNDSDVLRLEIKNRKAVPVRD